MKPEKWYRVEFSESLIVGTYHLRLTDIHGHVHDAYRYYSGPETDLPVISLNSFCAYKDGNGKLFIPDEVFQILETAGNGFEFGLHLRTNDNANRSYARQIQFDRLNIVPVKGDLDKDGDVDGEDLNLFSQNFGVSPMEE